MGLNICTYRSDYLNLLYERKPAFIKEPYKLIYLLSLIDPIRKIKVDVMELPQAQKNFGKQKFDQKALRFAELDRQNFKTPLHRLVVLYNRTTNIAAIILYIVVGGLSVLLLITSHGAPQSLMIVFLNLIILAIIIFYRMAAKRKAIAAFDAHGITCADGRQLLWTNFKGKHITLRRTQSGFKRIWRVEFIFSEGGEVWLIPLKVKNYDEVLSYVQVLPDAIAK